jgi:hypothetical protein
MPAMPSPISIRVAAVAVLVLLWAACGKDGGKPPPEKHWSGSPVACVVDKIGPDSVDISAYNFADKPTAQYMFLIQYKDKDGNVLKVKPGTPFEDDHEFMSMSGRSFMIQPKAWATMTIDMLEPPAGAASAEVIASKVGVVVDGQKIEDYWELEGGWSDWPAKPAGK